MQKIVNKLITSSIKGVDVYRWKDATWLIFTDETRWVVELTDEGTLWYNYKFFKDVFKYVSINVGTEMDGYIIQWANDFFYKDCAHRSAAYPRDKDRTKTPKVLENGIKDVSSTRALGVEYIENVVEGGIKETQGRGKNHGDEFEWHTRAVIDNGVKEILQSSRVESNSEVIGEVIEKGIKEVNNSESIHRKMRAENLVPRIIKDVKPNRVILHDEKMDRFYYDPNCRANKTEIWRIVEEVKPNIEYSKQTGVYHPDCVANHVKIEKVIEEGVKNIYPDMDPDNYDWSDEFKADNVIQGGIKVIPLPTIKDLRGYSDYYNTKEDKTKPHTEYVKDAIEGGVKL
jgi:predicted peroxiredoxin